MSTSINGWPILPTYEDPNLVKVTIPGTNCSAQFAKGAAPILVAFITELKDLLAPTGLLLDHPTEPDFWGYEDGTGHIGGSNHYSGTASDCYSTRWPRYRYTATATQRRIVHSLLVKYQGAITWGGNWSPQYLDEMHFEVTNGWTKVMLDRVMGELFPVIPPVKPPVVIVEDNEDDMYLRVQVDDAGNYSDLVNIGGAMIARGWVPAGNGRRWVDSNEFHNYPAPRGSFKVSHKDRFWLLPTVGPV